MTRTHDYLWDNRGRGHDISFEPVDGGMKLRANGWGPKGDRPIEVGDYMLLSHGRTDESARYRVDEIRYMSNPRDQWFGTLSFAPRPLKAEAKRDD